MIAFGEAEYRELCDYTHAKGMGILHQHLLTMHLLIILKIWSISTRFLLQIFQIFHLFIILDLKESLYIYL